MDDKIKQLEAEIEYSKKCIKRFNTEIENKKKIITDLETEINIIKKKENQIGGKTNKKDSSDKESNSLSSDASSDSSNNNAVPEITHPSMRRLGIIADVNYDHCYYYEKNGKSFIYNSQLKENKEINTTATKPRTRLTKFLPKPNNRLDNTIKKNSDEKSKVIDLKHIINSTKNPENNLIIKKRK